MSGDDLGYICNMKESAALFWSGGKDAAFAFSKCSGVRIEKLITTFDAPVQSTMHQLHPKFIEQQAGTLDLPLIRADVSSGNYIQSMEEITEQLKKEGIENLLFGDLFLEEIMNYRKQMFESRGLRVLFPIKSRNTARTAEEMINSGLEAVITVVDTDVLDESFLGRNYDHSFLKDIPEHIDPCGENGEFHTFCTRVSKKFPKVNFVPDRLTHSVTTFNKTNGESVKKTFAVLV